MVQNNNRTEISEFGEFGLIQHLTKNFENRHAFTIKGIGDDAAVIDNPGKQTLITTDMLVEGIHFDLMYTPLKHLGYKSVVVNLSDIYAMNGVPRQITFSYAVSSKFSVEALEEIYEGVYAACRKYEVDLVGGDTCPSQKGLIISVTAVGEALVEDVVYRDNARAGDVIFVSGDLGAAFLGLQLMEREKQIFLENPNIQPDLEGQDYIVGRQLKPEARKDVIELLTRMKIRPNAMIDVSDGLSSDLMHICKSSGKGALIHEELVPISEQAFKMALKFNIVPINCALNGGEDYELLFTVSKEDAKLLEQVPGLTQIGDILEADQGIRIKTKGGNLHDLVAGGWNSFPAQ